jgi:hypothetical protein
VDELNIVTPNRDLQSQELEIVTYVLKAFQEIPQDSRRRVVDTVARFFDLRTENVARAAMPSRSPDPVSEMAERPTVPTFSEDRSITPKQFMFQKQPRTDVEKAACLAYYLTHYRDAPYFKTLDISKLNTEAAQVKFSNPAVAVENATKQLYLVPATKGNKQISALGEQFVLALPDRDQARDVMNNARPRRRGRREQPDS